MNAGEQTTVQLNGSQMNMWFLWEPIYHFHFHLLPHVGKPTITPQNPLAHSRTRPIGFAYFCLLCANQTLPSGNG